MSGYSTLQSSLKKARIKSTLASVICTSTGGGSGTPGGSTTQIQYNNAGAFGGFGSWDGTTFALGTLGYSDTGIVASFQSSTNSYNQVILQNTSNGATASTNFNVSNNQGTATTNFGEFGINSSGFTGTGSFSQPGYVYLAAATTDLVIGTYGNMPIHFTVNSGATDAMLINASGNVSIGAQTDTAKLLIRKDSLGTTFSNANGLYLLNLAVAASGLQQISPPLVLSGQGWKTNSTAASQSVEFSMYVLPVQGAANPSGNWLLNYSINGGAATSLISAGSNGNVQIGSGTGTARLGIQTSPSGAVLQVIGTLGVNAMSIQSSTTAALFTINDSGGFTIANGAVFTFLGPTGTKLGAATTDKLGFWNTTPIIQPATGGAASTFTANTSGIANDTATWDSYTIGQVVKALRNTGLLA